MLARGNSLNGETGLTDHLSGTARREKTDILLDEALGQVQETSLVIDGNDGCKTERMLAIVLTRLGGSYS
jgi:hypothetical protein